MGCVSSKLFRKELERDILCGINGDYGASHVVSLTSTTYGALKLEESNQQKLAEKKKKMEEEEEKEIVKIPPNITTIASKTTKRSPPQEKDVSGDEEEEEEEAEVINAWELMRDLEEEVSVSIQARKSPKSVGFIGGHGGNQGRSPFKRLNQMVSPKTVKKLTGGKENRAAGGHNGVAGGSKVSYFTPNRVTKTLGDSEKLDSPSGSASRRRRSLSPLIDPELVEGYEKELSEEEEQIKKIISEPHSTRKSLGSDDLENPHLERFEKKCPPGGENSVVFYTTTLRGIRKTFEDCNAVRSILECYSIRMYERDVSMDSGFKEELRKLMGSKEFKVPLVFVKGRLIGGADEISKMEEESKLGRLLDGIPRTELGAVCEGCCGIRFVMCLECNGSCKVLGEADQKKMVRCGECNENGLVKCPICC